jgi:hypothetical protein
LKENKSNSSEQPSDTQENLGEQCVSANQNNPNDLPANDPDPVVPLADNWMDENEDVYEGEDANGDEVEDDDDDTAFDSYLDPWDAGVEPDAKGAVEQWKIVADGRRPEDYLARDCLYGSLLWDKRATWFRNYLKKPERWMEELVAQVTNKTQQRQALQCVVLDYLHKLHLARLYPVAQYEYGEGMESNLFKRLWRCTPYTVQVVRRKGGKNIRGCGYPRLCPWCFARRVVQLYEIVRRGPLSKPTGKFLLLGKPSAFAEPSGGIDGNWKQADWLSYTQSEEVRGQYGRYFGLNPGRAAETRKVLSRALLTAAADIGATSGLLTYQLGSAKVSDKQRTFLHDLGLIAEVIADTGKVLSANGSAHWKSVVGLESEKELALNIHWVLLPADKASSLRVAMTGTTVGDLQKRSGTRDEALESNTSDLDRINGALSWQPTFLLDDQMWFPYVQEIRNQRLYLPFGSWSDSMASVAAAARSSIDRRFQQAQAARHALNRQQSGNRKRRKEVEDRRAELLNIARVLWPQVQSDVTGLTGRPGHRKRLAELLEAQGIETSRRDLKWLMQQLNSQEDGTQ